MSTHPAPATPQVHASTAVQTSNTSSSSSASSNSSSSSSSSSCSSATSRVSRDAALQISYPSLFIQPVTSYLLYLHSRIRDKNVSRSDFVFYADQLLRYLIEFALSTLPHVDKQVETPTGTFFHGIDYAKEIIGVSILRAGESMEQALRSVIRNVKIGKILIQRDETSSEKLAKLFYCKLPANIENAHVLLLDPMLATGNSAVLAIKQLEQVGVKLENLTYINLISAPEGIKKVLQAYPQLKVVSGMVDDGLNSSKFILPGIGDFGDRYFGT